MLILVLIILPFLLGLFLIQSRTESIGAKMAIGVTLLQGLVFGYLTSSSADSEVLNSLSTFDKIWIERYNVHFSLGFDGLSKIMLGVTIFGSALIFIALNEFTYPNKGRMAGWLLLSQASLIGLFAAKDVILFYFFYELALIPIVFMANIWGGEGITKVTFRMLIYTIFGSLLMLVALIFLLVRGHTGDIDTLRQVAQSLSEPAQVFLFTCFLIAFGIKMPLFPLHTWLPRAYTESPTPATMMLSGLLSKMGVYGFLRILIPLSPIAVEKYGVVVVAFGVFGLIYGSVIAIQQKEIKKMIAYSSFSHMGMMGASAITHSVDGFQGAIFQMVSHAFSAVGLFYCYKFIEGKTNVRRLDQGGGLSKTMPSFSIMFFIIVLGSIALPLTSGFIGEFLMLKSIYSINPGLGMFAALSIIFGAVYMLKLYQRLIFGEQLVLQGNRLQELRFSGTVVMVPVAALIILLGLFPNFILKVSQSYAETLFSIFN